MQRYRLQLMWMYFDSCLIFVSVTSSLSHESVNVKDGVFFSGRYEWITVFMKDTCESVSWWLFQWNHRKKRCKKLFLISSMQIFDKNSFQTKFLLKRLQSFFAKFDRNSHQLVNEFERSIIPVRLNACYFLSSHYQNSLISEKKKRCFYF